MFGKFEECISNNGYCSLFVDLGYIFTDNGSFQDVILIRITSSATYQRNTDPEEDISPAPD